MVLEKNTDNFKIKVQVDENESAGVYDIAETPNAVFVRKNGTISKTPSRDLDFCINTVLKEAVKDDQLIKQIFLTMLSAYTYKPLNLAINAPSGVGKSHVLTKVADLFPKGDVIFITDMSNKAIFHKDGYSVIRNEDGEYVNIEDEYEELKQEFELLYNELKNTDPNKRSEIQELTKQLKENEKIRNEIRKNAVKLIDLSHKILIFLDTPREGIFESFMTLLSHDKYKVEYQYADPSSKTGIKTKTNILRGWPAVIFAQAIDYTHHSRYEEIQRRFVITNPRMDVEKYQNAVIYTLEKNCNPDFVYQKKIVSDNNKETAREIILNIKDDILSFTVTTKPGQNNTLVPFLHLISEILSKNATAYDMTFANRLTDLMGLLTIINYKKRPFIEIKPSFDEKSFRVPMSLYSDLKEALQLINNSEGGIRPYVLEWYNTVFLELYKSKSKPDSITKDDNEISEKRTAVTTMELIEKTKIVKNKTYTTKSILNRFIYPLLNIDYIDKIKSELDRRSNIYYPIVDPANEEKNSNLFLLGKKNNLIDDNSKNNINFITEEDKNQIISKIMEAMRYSSEDGNLNSIKFAYSDIDQTKEEYDLVRTVEEVVDKYYSTLPYNKILENSEEKFDSVIIKNGSDTVLPEEYPQIVKNNNISQNYHLNNIKNYSFNKESSKNLFHDDKRNKLIYFCYWCEFQTDSQIEYERHCVLSHAGKSGYPNMTSIIKNRLKPQGKPWEN